MCGISGIVHSDGRPVDAKILKTMNDQISSRGPDDEGFHIQNSVGLGHRRLSIIDLSGGHQPMTTSDGRYTLVFNGEIYNFQEIRPKLEKLGYTFKTHSDSEVLLNAFHAWKEDALQHFNGMFAFAIWDEQEQSLFLARDRTGQKPLYYGKFGSVFVFASELKAILKHPDVSKTLCPDALQHYLTYECVPAPYSMIQGVYKLKQAYFLKLKNGEINTHRYWNQKFDYQNDVDEKQASKTLMEKLVQAIEYRMISDVPVGVFLSGGVDSSTVVALLHQQRQGKDIKTFSINFEEASYDESTFSSEVAKKFGTDHYEKTLTASTMVDILPQVCDYMDEPFADGSILPTYLLSQFTRQHVTVALGGDGADELFAGYPTFFASRVANAYQKMPNLFKKMVVGSSKFLPTSDKNMSFDFKVRQFLMGASHKGVRKNQLWLAGILPSEQKNLLLSSFQNTLKSDDPLQLIDDEMKNCPSQNPNDQLLYFYQKFYMCDDILVKVDRASMAHSLEARAPFLDVNVIEYVNNLPYHLKLKGVTSKYLLKKCMNRHLPAMITQRSKKGFGIPIAGWLKKELKPILQSTLSNERIHRDGIFVNKSVQNLIDGHLSGKQNNRKQLFSLLMLHFWMDRYL